MSGGHQLGGSTLRDRTRTAVDDPTLRSNVAAGVDRFAANRAAALDTLVDPEGLRSAARSVKAEILAELPAVLERFADRLGERGGSVYWADTGADANRYIADVARRIGARTVAKSKSMATEETGLNEALAAEGCRVIETDLGEWIIQLASETPSHIIAPALHRNRYSIRDLFVATAGAVDLSEVPEELNAFARVELRREFVRADLGVSGANFGVAETGSIVLVTNEGNGRMVTSLPRVHVAVLGMERVVADWDQLELMLGLLPRSATGQALTSYTSVISGPRQPGERDGPDEMHVVILDNGRSELLGTQYHEMLACIRCGACLNACPVYRQVGGHAYGWVYTGPMGAVLTPLLARRQAEAAEVADASTLCGACMDACPVQIPLQDLLLALRRDAARTGSRRSRAAWSAWSAAWSRPWLYGATTRGARYGRRLTPVLRRLPGLRRWAGGRALPLPTGRRFRDRWARGEV